MTYSQRPVLTGLLGRGLEVQLEYAINKTFYPLDAAERHL